jgi:SpoVK/Ycf46/Vps4 family AAA+-type ATPase
MLHLPTVKENLIRFINAGYPILYIQTFDEDKADSYIINSVENTKLLEWNGASGLIDFKTKSPKQLPDKSLEYTLNFLKSSNTELNRHMLVIKDADKLLESEKIIALLKEIARKIRTNAVTSTVIIVSPSLHIPPSLEKLITVIELAFPGEEEIKGIIKEFREDNEITVHQGLIDSMVLAFKGLTAFEIEDLLGLAYSTDGELTNSTLQLIFEQKKQMILKSGVLEMVPLKESIAEIGGLENLKEWLRKKAIVFKDIKKAEEFGVVMPKGVLIAGIPGCGKSLSAKAVGALFDVPLLRLDMGRLMGRYVGESEENMRKAIQLAEAMSPCVLWVDELEKAFAGISGGSEVTTRLFGTFLTWMQEKTCSAFVVATANKITELPPELLRKGRFDEIFYVGLPNPEERKKIFEIRIEKRKQDYKQIDLDALVSQTDGYSGADIEGVVNESVESVFVKGKPALTTEDVLEAIHNTHSLSEIMKDELGKMDKEYNDRKFKKASR